MIKEQNYFGTYNVWLPSWAGIGIMSWSVIFVMITGIQAYSEFQSPTLRKVYIYIALCIISSLSGLLFAINPAVIILRRSKNTNLHDVII